MIQKNSWAFIFLAAMAFFMNGCSVETPVETYPNASLDFTAAVQQGKTFAIPDDFTGFMHAGYSNDPDQEYALVNELGSCWIQRDFSWSSIQPSQDQWNWTSFDAYVERANTEGKKILGMLLYDVNWVHDLLGHTQERRIQADELPYFCAYAREAVKRYNGNNGHGKVDAWCIWNEPNLDRFWKGTQEEFFDLTKATAQEIRTLDAAESTNTVLVGGVFNTQVTPDWVDGLFGSGAMAELNYIAFHPYHINADASYYIYNVFKNRVAPYGFDDKIWINEIGYPSYSEKGPIPAGRYGTDVYEGDMPEMVTKTFTLLAEGGAKTLFWYQLFDPAIRDNSNSEDWFGLVWKKSDTGWIKKGGYWGYALCAKNLPGKTYKEMSYPGSDIPDTIQTSYFEGDDGKRVLILWNDSNVTALNLTITLPGENRQLWNPANGSSTPVNKSSSYTLYPRDTYKRTLLFFTWDENNP